MLRELIAHRDLLWLLVVRELRIRYARALLGIGWAVFLPLIQMLTFSVLDFGRLIPADSPLSGTPYAVFAYVGILPWTFFATSLTLATPSLVVSATLIKKSAFPREVIPLAKILACLFDLAVGAVVLGILLAAFRIPLRPAAAVVVPVLLLQVAFTTGLALLFSAANMFFRDVNYLVSVGLLLAMFATSVVYPIAVTSRTVGSVLRWNPMTSYLDAYRDALILGTVRVETLVPGVVGAAVALVVGVSVFRSLRFRFAEEV